MPGPRSTLVDNSLLSELDACRGKLTKKATFETSLKEVIRLMHQQTQQFALPEVEQKLLEVSARCVTLLKTRHTLPAFWRAGSELLAQAQV